MGSKLCLLITTVYYNITKSTQPFPMNLSLHRQSCKYVKMKTLTFLTLLYVLFARLKLEDLIMLEFIDPVEMVLQFKNFVALLTSVNNYSLNSEKWSLEVLTGALKLFFRELKEPLITFKIYPEVDQLLGNRDMAPDLKVAKMRDLINSMPLPHVNTSRIFFHHLYRVAQLSNVNQMHSYNLAIVFGPSLIWPEVESGAYKALKSVQVPCVEYLITHAEEIFGTVTPPPVIS
uniref:Rho GTPase-activating protein 12 n=1 Tax=Schistosoma japonicum TaxID=6182 RepID=C1LIT4_SCHJA|nr:Rho GTPase-activating protein 12 [Schistosoma japonicum]